MRRFLCGVAGWLLALPVTPWGWYHERRILRSGRELTGAEMASAKAIGVLRPSRVRILAVDRVPNPLGALFGLLDRWTGLACFDPAGLTLRYGIFAVPPADTNLDLIAHELVHTSQYERAGGLFGFLRRYISQCLADGYAGAEWEREAREKSSWAKQ